jgi:hypothetical protein
VPTCGAKPGEKCELGTGVPRTNPHRDRRLAASDMTLSRNAKTDPLLGLE